MDTAADKKRIAIILALDMAGFSSRTETDEQSAVASVAALRARVAAAATAYGGRIFNTAGDGIMLEFAAASEALQAVLDLLTRAPADAPPIRIGMHVGEIAVAESGDLLGHGVNVAARLEALAQPGMALVSRAVADLVRGDLHGHLVPCGRVALDGLGPAVDGRALDDQPARGRPGGQVARFETVGEDGCPMFTAVLALDLADEHRTFKWGVVLDGPQGSNFWGIPTEVQDVDSVERYRPFRLTGSAAQLERYYLTYLRRLGANKRFPPGSPVARLQFSVWAPNAHHVDVVFSDPTRGYISDNGTGIDATAPVIALVRSADGIWEGGPHEDFDAFNRDVALSNVAYRARIRERPSRFG